MNNLSKSFIFYKGQFMNKSRENYVTNFYGLKSPKSTMSATVKSKEKCKNIANLVQQGLKNSMISRLLKMTPNHVSNYIRLARRLQYLPSKENFNVQKHCSHITFYKLHFLRRLNFSIRECAMAMNISLQSVYNYFDRNIEDVGDETGIIFEVKKPINDDLFVGDILLIKTSNQNNTYELRYRKLNTLESLEDTTFAPIDINILKDTLIVVSAYPVYYVLSQNKMLCHP